MNNKQRRHRKKQKKDTKKDTKMCRNSKTKNDPALILLLFQIEKRIFIIICNLGWW